MKIKQIIEKEIERVSFSIEKPHDISIYATGKSDYDFIDLRLTGEDLQLSKQFCDMLKKRIQEKFQIN